MVHDGPPDHRTLLSYLRRIFIDTDGLDSIVVFAADHRQPGRKIDKPVCVRHRACRGNDIRPVSSVGAGETVTASSVQVAFVRCAKVVDISPSRVITRIPNVQRSTFNESARHQDTA